MLNPKQYGFQKYISTANAILNSVTSIYCRYDNINGYQRSAIFFLDLKNAFDTVWHKTLFRKFDHYEHFGPVNTLLDSCLPRYQFVSLNSTHATIRLNCYGVPQASTLGLLLFLLYVNSLPDPV